MAETCPNAELCCICKEPSHRAWFCRFSWYCDVSPTSSPAPQCQDMRQDTHQDTSRDMPLVANPPDPQPSSVPPSDSQPPLPARTPRTFLTPKVFSFSVICLVMMMTSPVFFSNSEVDTSDDDCTDHNAHDNDDEDDDADGDDNNDDEDNDDDNDGDDMVTPEAGIPESASAGPDPASLGTPKSASADLVPTPPGDREFASAEPADDSPADVTLMESQPLLSSTESEPLGFSVLQDPKPQHSKSRFSLIRCSICCVEIQRRCLRP